MKAVLLMSGGVDSTASAIIMKKAGYEVVGLTLDLRGEMLSSVGGFADSVERQIERVREVADEVGIEHRLVGAGDLFENMVVIPFIDGYARGITPNPCVLCNPAVKFRVAREVADEVGADTIASGHYAMMGEYKGRQAIMRGAFREKEQSYFLWRLDPSITSRLEFPVGGITKDEARDMVREAGVDAIEQESQEVCFLRNISVGEFIDRFQRQREGDIVDLGGNVLGRHRGIAYYTIGQREGLGIGGVGPYYVVEIDAEGNRVVVGREDDLYRDYIEVGDVNILVGDIGYMPENILVQVRYRTEAVEARFIYGCDGKVMLDFNEPVKAPALGQSAVFYDGDVLLGGGVIIKNYKYSR